MTSSSRSDILKILRELAHQGWDIALTASGHYRCVPPDKNRAIVICSASGEPRAIRNAKRQLIQSGANL